MNAQLRNVPVSSSLLCTFEQALFDRLDVLTDAWFSARHTASNTIFSTFMLAMKAKNLELYHHSYRVQYFASHLSAALGFSEEEKITIELGALFHDIGKLAIQNSILQKPSRLTKEEFAQIQQHPAHGAFILSHVPQLQQLVPVAYYHHERWDGTGYPFGLQKTAIPFYARIISIADAFEVMISRRTYKKASSPLKAFTELHRCAGTQFDPELVDAFCSCVTNEVLLALN